ncbi:MAG TPA: gamma-glutamyl-gamma-aminobutyrate hydrolase family protein, partial [Bacteroidales bacterium]|nr:gamma-glutamyl-gamma-aminobutyrate hydrolase family protein [Bacteroidales bacterium]
TMINLVDKELISLEGFRLVGVYHHHERYDYSRSRQFLDTLGYVDCDIVLREITDTIHPEVLYGKNELSDDYRTIFRQSSGVIFFGGPDLPPEVYGEQTSLYTSIYDPFRHYFELSFLHHLLGGSQQSGMRPLMQNNPGYLVYGFCLGMQTMNVATGGTLVQDIPSGIYNLRYVEEILRLDRDRIHRNYNRAIHVDEDLISGSFHSVHFSQSPYTSRLALDGFHPVVYSNHHQAVDEPGRGFQVTATSMDGKVVEGIIHERYDNVIGVQFHPEAYFLYDTTRTFRIAGDDTLSFTGWEMLEKTRSLEFHKKYWKDFERRLREQ